MPIYEYLCGGCEHEFEVMQRITADSGATCPECGGDKCRRLMSQTSFKLKGSGWYVTDYGAKKKAPPANGAEPSEAASSSDSASSDSASSDSAAKAKPSDAAPSSSKADSAAAKPKSSSKE
jgi:putative FmdB family regulatory protein